MLHFLETPLNTYLPGRPGDAERGSDPPTYVLGRPRDAASAAEAVTRLPSGRTPAPGGVGDRTRDGLPRAVAPTPRRPVLPI